MDDFNFVAQLCTNPAQVDMWRQVMTNGLMRLADLRQLLLDMERDLGLADLPEQETRLLYAVAIQTRAKPEVSLVELQTSVDGRHIPQHVFSGTETLIKRGYLEKTGAEKRAGYKLINAPLSFVAVTIITRRNAGRLAQDGKDVAEPVGTVCPVPAQTAARERAEVGHHAIQTDQMQ